MARSLFTAVLTAGVLASGATAATLTYQIAGQFEGSAPFPELNNAFVTFTGTIESDSPAVDGNDYFRDYRGTSPASLTIEGSGGIDGTYFEEHGPWFLAMFGEPGWNMLNIGAGHFHFPGIWADFTFFFEIHDDDGTIFDDLAIPTSVPDLASCEYVGCAIYYMHDPPAPIYINDFSFTITPEPGTLFVLAAGGLLVAKRRR